MHYIVWLTKTNRTEIGSFSLVMAKSNWDIWLFHIFMHAFCYHMLRRSTMMHWLRYGWERKFTSTKSGDAFFQRLHSYPNRGRTIKFPIEETSFLLGSSFPSNFIRYTLRELISLSIWNLNSSIDWHVSRQNRVSPRLVVIKWALSNKRTRREKFIFWQCASFPHSFHTVISIRIELEQSFPECKDTILRFMTKSM
jgi:hypothetical protein